MLTVLGLKAIPKRDLKTASYLYHCSSVVQPALRQLNSLIRKSIKADIVTYYIMDSDTLLSGDKFSLDLGSVRFLVGDKTVY